MAFYGALLVSMAIGSQTTNDQLLDRIPDLLHFMCITFELNNDDWG